MAKVEKVISYKGFYKDWKCRDFQFEVGKTFTHEGKVKICSSGFHACEYPLDVFNYYEPATSKFAVVEQSGDLSRENTGSKLASRKIKIKVAVDIPYLIKAAIEYTTSKCEPSNSKHSDGHRSASSATGDRSASSATGHRSASSATGDRSASSATGYRSASISNGDQSASSVTGDQSASSVTGDQSASSVTGDRSASSATGDQSASISNGDQSASSSTGDQSASSVTGYQSASSVTGYRSASSATGYQSASSATGDQSSSSSDGKNSVAMNIGIKGKAKASLGGAIVVCEHDSNNNLIGIKSALVGNGEGQPKPDAFYMLVNGEFVEA